MIWNFLKILCFDISKVHLNCTLFSVVSVGTGYLIMCNVPFLLLEKYVLAWKWTTLLSVPEPKMLKGKERLRSHSFCPRVGVVQTGPYLTLAGYSFLTSPFWFFLENSFPSDPSHQTEDPPSCVFSASWDSDHPPVHRWTDMTENITLPHTKYVIGEKFFHLWIGN